MMKVIVKMVLIFILFAGTANAQHSSQKATIGIKGGVNLYNIHTNTANNFDAKFGWNAGLLAHIHLLPHLALQPEVFYSGQGSRNKVTEAKVSYNLNYVNVPVLLQYMFDNGFRIQVGPQAGFLVSAKQKIDNMPSNDIKKNFKSTDVGIVGGISYVQPSTGLGFDVRYNLGLTNINNIGPVKETNRGAQLGIFYLIHHRH